MARPKNSVPTYRLHSPSNTARCWVNGAWVTLGRYNSPESRAEYARILAELAVAPIPSAVAPACVRVKDVTINELLLGFWRFAETHYRRADGTPTNELPQFAQTFRLVRSLYGHTPAGEFGPLALKAVREKMIETGWARKLINQRVGRIRRAFKWAVENELVSPVVFQALAAVRGLQAGRTTARETAPVEPVADAVVDATLPFLRPAVRAMVRVQRLTGMRPGEVCQLRPCDLDTTRPVWRFTPPQFKTKHRGKKRIISIGPKAQAELAAFAPPDPTDYYFSPKRVVADLHAERGSNRVHQDRAVRVSPAEGEVIDAQYAGRGSGDRRDRPDPTEKGVATGGEGQPVTGPRTGLLAEGVGHVPSGVNERVGGAGVRTDGGESFAEGATAVAGGSAAEASGGDPPLRPTPVRGHIGDGAKIPAVNE